MRNEVWKSSLRVFIAFCHDCVKHIKTEFISKNHRSQKLSLKAQLGFEHFQKCNLHSFQHSLVNFPHISQLNCNIHHHKPGRNRSTLKGTMITASVHESYDLSDDLLICPRWQKNSSSLVTWKAFQSFLLFGSRSCLSHSDKAN